MNDVETRLRNALTEVAATVEVGQSRLTTPRAPRRQRPRLLAAGIAAAAVIAIAVSAAVLANRNGDSSTPATTPATSAEDDRLSYDLEVFMEVDALETQILAVGQALGARPDVVRVGYVDKEAAYVEFSEIFWCRPDLVNATSPEALPTSFRLVLTPGTDRTVAEGEIQALPSVDDVLVVTPRTSPPPDESQRTEYDIEVFMYGEATAADIAAVDQALRERPDVEQVTYVDRETAYAEFSERFRDQPDLLNATDPENLPAFVRLVLTPGTDPVLLAEEIPLLPGVESVVDAQSGECPPRS